MMDVINLNSIRNLYIREKILWIETINGFSYIVVIQKIFFIMINIFTYINLFHIIYNITKIFSKHLDTFYTVIYLYRETILRWGNY